MRWYAGSCQGTPIGFGTSILVSPSSTTTYYARWESTICGISDCASVTLPVNSVASITSSPADQSVRLGITASLTVAATGSNLAYQWQVSKDGGATFANVTTGTGGTTATYRTPAAGIGDNGARYRCMVSGACPPPIFSNAATLTVTPEIVLLYEGFEAPFANGAPFGWTKQFNTDTLDWVRTSGDEMGGAAAVGSYNAMLYAGSRTFHETYLVTPEITFHTSCSSASLEFWHRQAFWFPDQDTLSVYYKTSAGGPWNQLASYASDVPSWTKRTVTLPNLSSDYYIGFLGNAKYGYGVCIDDVLVWQVLNPISVSDAKLLTEGSMAYVAGKTVTYAATDYLYVEENSRACGIRVEKTAHGLSVGDRIDLVGSLLTNSDGERYVAAASFGKVGTGAIAPVGVGGTAIGGADWQYDPVGKGGQKGITGASGLNNIGLLLKTWGHFRLVDSSTFVLEDGFGRYITCKVPPGTTLSPAWTYAAVTGVCSVYNTSGTYQPQILVREIQPY